MSQSVPKQIVIRAVPLATTPATPIKTTIPDPSHGSRAPAWARPTTSQEMSPCSSPTPYATSRSLASFGEPPSLMYKPTTTRNPTVLLWHSSVQSYVPKILNPIVTLSKTPFIFATPKGSPQFHTKSCTTQ